MIKPKTIMIRERAKAKAKARRRKYLRVSPAKLLQSRTSAINTQFML